MTNSVKDIKQKQIINLIGLVLVFCGVLGVAFHFMSAPAKEGSSAKKIIAMDSALDQIDSQSFFLEQAQRKLQEDKEKYNKIEQRLQEIETNKLKDFEFVDEDKYKSLLDKIAFLESEIEKNKSMAITPAQFSNKGDADNLNMPLLPKIANQDFAYIHNDDVLTSSAMLEEDGLDNLEISLSTYSIAANNPVKTPDTFVSSGTIAKAIVLGGIDASAGVTSQSNPRPTLFRIINNGIMPNGRKSHLKDCVVTAAGYGDISSERGHIRLERLSCVKPNNEVIELKVDGTVFDRSGIEGIRGKAVWREGALLQRAFAAGALSGFSDGLSKSYTTVTDSLSGPKETVNGSDIFKYGAGKGTSSAMDKLADYNIKRAEQYQPVIEINAMQTIDIVFLKGFYLDGGEHKDIEAENSKAEPKPYDFGYFSQRAGNEQRKMMSDMEEKAMHAANRVIENMPSGAR